MFPRNVADLRHAQTVGDGASGFGGRQGDDAFRFERLKRSWALRVLKIPDLFANCTTTLVMVKNELESAIVIALIGFLTQTKTKSGTTDRVIVFVVKFASALGFA
jgi:hypothetical protein